MSDMDVLIEQMVSEIGTEAWQLDVPRLRMFLNWIMSHGSEMKDLVGNVMDADPALLQNAEGREQFQSALQIWLQSLPVQGLLWEYRTITGEIGWLCDLDPVQLQMIAKTEGES